MSVSELRPNREFESQTQLLTAGTSVANSELRKQTLMVVDDYRSNLQAMNALFEFQYQVVMFDNAKEALAFAQVGSVDLILLDLDMPDMHGYDACTELKSNPLTAHIPVIFVTASDSSDDEARGLLLGAVDYITKPVNLTILRARVRNHMELVYYRKQLEILSSVDGLTGVANRRQLDTMLLQHYASTLRFGHSMTLMMIDIDDFKPYNDLYGHMQGDDCLKRVAKALQSVRRRETDFVGRNGGEEFAMVLPDTDLEGGLVVANKLLQAVRVLNIEHQGASETDRVTISIGLTSFEAKGDQSNHHSVEALIELADKQLYIAKRSGKNRVSYDQSTQLSSQPKADNDYE